MQNRILVPVAVTLLACLVPQGYAIMAIAQTAGAADATGASRLQVAGTGVTPAAADYFAPYVAYPVGSYPEAVAIGDLNHDGRNDVALLTSSRSDPANDYSVFVFLQDASGGLLAPVRYPTGATSNNVPRTMDIGDVTGDGRDDVVIGRDKHSIVVMPQSTTGTLNPGVSYPSTSAYQVRIGDFNSDGRKDVAAITYSRGYVVIFAQQTTGRLSLEATYAAAHQGGSDIDVGDMNGDGRDDLLITSGWTEGPDVAVLLQQPGGFFDTVRAYDWVPDDLPDSFAIGDVNGDGRDDAVFGHYTAVAVRHQNASGGIGAPTTFATTRGATAIEVADVDSNLRADVVVATTGNRVMVYRQGLDGTLAAPDEFTVPGSIAYNPQSAAVGDVTGDGAADIVLATTSNGLVVLVQKASQTVPTGVSSSRTPSGHIQITWTPYAGATSYQIYRRGVGPAFMLIGTSNTASFIDTAVAPNTAFLYRVRAVGPAGATAPSAIELATTVLFSDDPIVPGETPLKALHLAELRAAVAAVRALAGLPAVTFSADAGQGAFVRAAHITELRAALDPALASLSLPPQPYSEAIVSGGLIKAAHIQELRSRVR